MAYDLPLKISAYFDQMGPKEFQKCSGIFEVAW